MRIIIALAICVSISACQGAAEKQAPASQEEQHFIDSFKSAKQKEFNKEIAPTLFDTIGVSAAPIKIISSKLFTKEYSNYRDISVTYKNVSQKKIKAVRIKWYGVNAFDEPADMGERGIYQGFGGGFDDDGVFPGKTNTTTWGISSKDGKRIVLAWPYEVAFEDGTKWASK